MYFIVASSVLVLISIASRCAGAPALSPSEFLDVAGTSIAVGPDHACVLQRIRGLDYGGRSLCWGLEYHYKGGINPQAYDSEEIYIQVISGYRFSCGITLDQNVHCWGVLSTYAPKGLFNQLASSNRRLFACGVKVDGSISCFGKDHSRVKKLQGKIDNDKNRVYVQVSCASDHCCGLDVSGQTHCWGDFRFDYGQGTPPKTRKAVAVGMDGEILQEEEAEEDGYADGEQPEDPDDFEHVIFRQIAVTEQSSCGIRFKDNAIECWGNHRIAHGEVCKVYFIFIPRTLMTKYKDNNM
jgi:hypothetical protein